MVSEFLSGGTSLVQQPETPVTGKTAVVEQQFLRFHLSGETTALLPVHQMTEVLAIPVTQIVPIPHMPPWVMGVYNWRGEILWIADLGHLVGFTPLYQQTISHSTYTAIVIHGEQQMLSRAGRQITGRKMLGLVVNRVEDMESFSTDLIQSPPQSTVTPELVPFLRGYWMKPNGEMLMVFEGKSIIAGMPKTEA